MRIQFYSISMSVQYLAASIKSGLMNLVDNFYETEKLTIRNFRKIQELTVIFPSGLTVIVGENNSGKTAIIDALRLMLFPSRDFDALRLNEDDFRTGTDPAPIEISCVFGDAKDEDEVHFRSVWLI